MLFSTFVFTLEESVPFLKMHVIFSFVTFLVCFPFVREDLESSQLNLSKYFSSLLPVKTNPLLVKPWQFEEECSRSCPAQQLPLRGEAQAVPHCSGPPARCAHSLSCFFQDGVTFPCNNILSSPGSHAPLHSGMAQYKECLIMFVYV